MAPGSSVRARKGAGEVRPPRSPARAAGEAVSAGAAGGRGVRTHSAVVLALAAALAAVLLHWNTVDGDFVWDDRRGVVENDDVRLDTPITRAFLDDFWG